MTVRLAISMGDPAGVGPDVLAGALNRSGRISDAVFFVVGEKRLLKDRGLRSACRVVFVDHGANSGRFDPGRPSRSSAEAGLLYLDKAVDLVKSGECDALVTAPISKEAVHRVGFAFPGHTEYLADAWGVRDVEMVFVGKRLRVATVTRHEALKDAVRHVTRARLRKAGRILETFLKRECGIRRPRIGVCGLNPHAGEEGLFGDEEGDVIAPALRDLNRGHEKSFHGPFAADTIFHEAMLGRWDLVLAMVHDQALAPFKTVEFSTGAQVTAGLPVVRTSPAHGTAYSIAGRGQADPGSMEHALRLAVDMTRNRRAWRA